MLTNKIFSALLFRPEPYTVVTGGSPAPTSQSQR